MDHKMNSLDQFFQTRRGWLFSLSAASDRGSDWGDVDFFLSEVEDESRRVDDCLIFKSTVRGKVLNKDCVIQEGDGIAFYHSKRAIFPVDDRFKNRQRISLMGIVEECHQKGLDISYLKVRIPEDVFEAFSDGNAIVWTPERDEAFIACGLRDGPVRAFYPATSGVWRSFLVDAAELVEEYTGEYPNL